MPKQKNPKKNPKNFPIKPFYTTNELRDLFGYKTNASARHFMMKLNVPVAIVGRHHYYYLSDIQTFAPALYSSICEASSLWQLKKEIDIDYNDENDKGYSAKQF